MVRRRTEVSARVALVQLALAAVLLAFPLARTARADAPPSDASASSDTGGPSEAAGASDATATTSLAVLLQAAEAHYPALAADGHAIDAARARLDEARVSPFFQWNVTGTFTVAPSAEGTPTYSPDNQLPLDNPWRPVSGVSVEGFVPIYTFGKLKSAREAASAGIDAAEHQHDRTLASVRYDVRRGYFALQVSLDTLEMITDGKSKLERAIDKLDDLLAAHDPSADPMDRYRLEAALAEVNARNSQALRLEATARAALRALTGLDAIRVPDCPLARVEFDASALEGHLDGAYRDRPEVGLLEAARRARRADLTHQRARYFPDLVLVFRAAYSHGAGVTDISNPFIHDPANDRSLGAALALRWSLDLWGTTARVRRAKALLAETRAQDQHARVGMQLEVDEAFEALEDAGRREEAWARGELQTRRWFIATAQGYQVGTSSAKDLIDALKAYFTARFSHISAIRDYDTALAKLTRVTGRELADAKVWGTSCAD